MTHDGRRSSDELSSITNAGSNMGLGLGRTAGSRSLWWLKLVQIRFRFLIVILIASALVGQWTTVQSLWDRWIWNSTSATATHGVSGAHEFFCPMDPGVRSAWPSICPICNMDLVPRRKTDAQLLPEGVVARMQLSPYRIQLAGIRTVVVEAKELQYRLSFTGTLTTLAPGDASCSPVGFDTFLSARDAAMFAESRSATIAMRNTLGRESAATAQWRIAAAGGDEERRPVRIILDDPTAMPAGSAVTAMIVIPAAAVLAADNSSAVSTGENRILCVPESALVDRGDEHFVYVESMPGMFDGTAVRVGRRMGSWYPVLSGLKPGQRVASAGAFLIDAEARLNPSLAAGYFGANPAALTSTPATAPIAAIRRTATASDASELSAEDQRIVDQQKICPVTELSLDSMGSPIPVMIGDRRVFICCAGCERRLRDEPEKYLSKIPTSK